MGRDFTRRTVTVTVSAVFGFCITLLVIDAVRLATQEPPHFEWVCGTEVDTVTDPARTREYYEELRGDSAYSWHVTLGGCLTRMLR